MKWTFEEKKDLRQQIKKGVPIEDVQVGDRTPASIHYQMYRLGLYTDRWKRNELTFLKKSIQEGKKPWQIEISGRTKIAIRNKAIRAKIWKTKSRFIHCWNMREIKDLIRLVGLGYTVKQLHSSGYFLERTKDSIAQQLRRLRRKNAV